MSVRLRLAVIVVALVAAVLPAVPAASEPNQPGGRVLFPTDELTVRDDSQLTGRRLDYPLPDCTQQPSLCEELRLINQLDGFDIEPRVVVQLDAAPNLDDLRRFNFHIERVGGGPRIRMNRLVYEPDTKRLYGLPRHQLREGATYRAVWNGEGTRSSTTFTTMSATRVLRQMRTQLDSGKAYRDAGIQAGAQRRIRFDILPEGGRAVFEVGDIAPDGLKRYNHRFRGEPLQEERVIEQPAARSGAGFYAFGYFRSPQWTTENRFIPHTPTKTQAPQVRRLEKVGVTMIVPAGTPPEGGWPTAIFGPGITRSKYDLFLAADANASQGVATLSFDPVGHAYGPKGEFGVTTASNAGEVRFPMFGRARDTGPEGEFDAITNVGVPQQPHRLATVALRDGLRQTAADMMALVRAIERGVDVDRDGTFDLRRKNVAIYAQSLGGIYGTMVAGVDHRVKVAALNVPGGPIVEIARLAPGFRPNVASSLGRRQPSLLNGGLDCFTESAPIVGAGPVTNPADGAIKIQSYAARSNWVSRPGSPEAFAPLLRANPLPNAPTKRFFYQFAYGDQTVPNPTSFQLARAGQMFDRVAYYRNDRSGTPDTNPHGFLLDPTIGPAVPREQGQAQILEFITSNGQTLIDPDGPGPEWEVPIADRSTLRHLHYNLAEQVAARGNQYNGEGCPSTN